MATTTPNYGWTVPTSTDLVKDGATAIETLGDAIDASMNTALGTKKAGMVLLNTTSFSGVVTQSINDVFSATYTNYRILLRLTSGGAAGNCNIRLRVSGADNTTNNYYSAFSFDRFTNATGNGGGNPSTAYVLPAMTSAGQVFSFNMDVFNPFTANTTLISYKGTGQDGTSGYSMVGGAYHEVSSSFTGFTLINNGGNFGTGSVSVYGYNV
jgi:hypothetical protein